MNVSPAHLSGVFISVFLTETVFTRLLDDFLAPRRELGGRKRLCALALSVAMTLTSLFIPNDSRMLFNIAILTSYVFILYRGGVGRRILLAATNIAMLILGEMLAVSLLTPFIDVSAGYLTGGATVNIMTAATFVAYFFEYLLIKCFRGAIDDRLSKRVWLGIVFYVATAFLAVCYVFCGMAAVKNHMLRNGGDKAFYELFTRDITGMLLILMLLTLIAMLFWILRDMNGSIKLMREQTLREQKALYAQREEKLQSVYVEKVTGMRRDMAMRLEKLEEFRLANDFGSQHAYIEEMLSGPLRAPTLPHCGNSLMDALFGAKAAVMEAEGINCRWRLEPVPFPLKIDDVSLSALVTNALDNAIESCHRLAFGADKWITAAVRAERTSLVIKIENACQDAEKTVALSRKKSGKRLVGAGYGLGIITDIVHAHSGEINFEAKDPAAVSLIIYLPNIMDIKGA